eukprot:m.26241 g.26241  ORF g.26241 m.26241 type:complete len:96 (-) comp5840_c0_seq2:70-357(-)
MLQSGKLRSGPSLEGGTNYRRPVQERTFFFFLFIAVERLFYVILENVFILLVWKKKNTTKKNLNLQLASKRILFLSSIVNYGDVVVGSFCNKYNF